MADIFNEMLNADGTVRSPYAQVHDWIRRLSKDACRAGAARRPKASSAGSASPSPSMARRKPPSGSSPSTSSRASSRPPNGGGSRSASSSGCARSTPSSTTSITARRSCAPGASPRDLILQNEAFVPEMVGLNPPRGVYAHIIGVDIVRVSESEFYVLEDNCRTPSGVSYMLEDREAMMYLFPELFKQPSRGAGRALSGDAAQDARKRGAGRARRRADDRAAHARHPQFGILRACLPRRRDGRRAVRGRRSLRRGRLSLYAHDAGAASASMSSIGGSTMPISIRSPSAPIRRSACRACSISIAPAASRSSMRRAPASPTTSRSTPTCPRSSSSIPARSRS